MANYQPVTREEHRNKSWIRNEGFTFAAHDPLIPLSASEVGMAASAVPMAFAEVAGKATLVMVCSLQPGRNLMVTPNGKWAISYVPAALHAYPFRLTGNGDKYALAVDASSGLIMDEGFGVSFFDENGKPTEETKAMLQLLLEFHRGQIVAQVAAAALADAGVLEPWNITVREANGERQVAGLSRVNERALGALDNTRFLDLRRSGALGIAYSQLISINQLALLKRLAEAHIVHTGHQIKPRGELGNIFAPVSGDQIDWDALLRGWTANSAAPEPDG